MALMFTDSPDVAALSVISYLNIEWTYDIMAFHS